MKTNISFWDTSAIVPLCLQQADSQQIRKLWRRMDRIVAWWGSPVEARSAINRLYRGGLLTPRQVQLSSRRLEFLREQWREVQPTDRLRAIAEQLPDTHGLRALDAFQLAAALLWCNEKPSHRLFVCLDDKLSEAARSAGFDTLP